MGLGGVCLTENEKPGSVALPGSVWGLGEEWSGAAGRVQAASPAVASALTGIETITNANVNTVARVEANRALKRV